MNSLPNYQKNPEELRYFIDAFFPIALEGQKSDAVGVIVLDITEQKKAEEMIKTRSHVLENMGEGVVVTDEDGIILYCNNAFEEMFGYEHDELIGKHGSVLYAEAPDKNKKLIENIIIELEKSGSWIGEISNIRKDGESFITATHVSTVELSGKNVWISVQNDITEQKEAEEMLITRSHVLENMAEGVNIADENGIILYCNSAFEDMWGYRRDELIGKHVSILNAATPEENKQIIENVLKELQKSGFWRGEFFNMRKDGSLFYTDAHISTIDIPEKRIWISVQNDITESKREEKEKSLRAAEMKALYQTSLEINKLADIDNLLNDIVKRAVTLLNVNRGELSLIQKNDKSLEIAAVFPPNEKLIGTTINISQGLAGRIAKSGEPYMLHEIKNKGEGRFGQLDGDSYRFLGVPLKVQERVIGVLSIFDEYHPNAFEEESIQLLSLFAAQAAIAVENSSLFNQVYDGRRELRFLSERLMRVNEDERKKIARELHDQIGQTLTAIKLNLENVNHMNVDASTSLELERSIKLVEASVNQVRELSLELRPPELDHLGLISALRWYIDRQAEHAGLTADIHLPENQVNLAPEAVTACFRIVQEAMTNTIRHASATEVRLDLLEHENMMKLTFQDDGVGFDSKAALAGIGLGINLGLTGMKERTELIGGKLEILSAPDNGTKIIVSVPLGSSDTVERRSNARKEQ